MEARTCFFLKHPVEELERGGGGGGEEGRHWELTPTPTPNPNLTVILVTFIVAANLQFPPAATVPPRSCF
ncbi:hypothetical protein NEUTE2DRAFT_124063 [Neurospora tetrasperma FGSC 2509]|nr:hypothetical protein NEUTE2DRAFT_124063 [Neurospora tetrasperma FGSC 2509]